MDKQEPKIIAPGYTNEELFIWMSEKAAAARELSRLVTAKDELLNAADKLEAKISSLLSHAAIEVLQQEGLASNQFQGVDEFDSSPDLLLVSSVVLKVVKAELERQNVQPSVENIRCVLSLIDGSLPAFAF